MDRLRRLHKFSTKTKKKVDKIIELLSIITIFLFGIGLTKIISKLFSKKFLEKDCGKTTWKDYQTNKESIKMY